jgi:hypothetical protein
MRRAAGEHERAGAGKTGFDTSRRMLGGRAGVCQLFEKRLKELNPTMKNITYDISDLYDFIDAITDLSALVYSPQVCVIHCVRSAAKTTSCRLTVHRGGYWCSTTCTSHTTRNGSRSRRSNISRGRRNSEPPPLRFLEYIL